MNKISKEEFIKQRMDIDKITRQEFDYLYEVEECNCDYVACRGWIAKDKENKIEYTDYLENKVDNLQQRIDLVSKLLKKYIGVLDDTADLYFENVLSILKGENNENN